MNTYIERLNNVSFATWNGLQISILQTTLLMAAIAGISYWLFQKEKKSLVVAMGCLLLFTTLRTIDFIKRNTQQQLIVYNVPRHQAIDVVNGRTYTFIDSSLLADDFLRNFHLQPSRILHRMEPVSFLPSFKNFQVAQKEILIIDSTMQFRKTTLKPVVDVVVLSRNPKIYMSSLNNAFKVEEVVIDASVPAWKARLWKQDCDSLHIPYYDVTERGAFVLNL